MKSLRVLSTSPVVSGLVLVSVLFLAGCGKKKNGEVATPKATHLNREEAISVLRRYESKFMYDAEFSDAELGALGYDLKKLGALEIAETKNTGPAAVLIDAYEKLFGGTTTNPIYYLFDRIKIISSAKHPFVDGKRPDKNVIAQNLSVGIWLGQMLEVRKNGGDPGSVPDFYEEGKVISRNSSRTGFIQLGDPYSEIDNSVERMGTLIHEGRHSDCPNGITKAQLDRIDAAGSDLGERLLEIIGNCGFLHPNCPEGHPLAGKAACESGEGWGAYSVAIPFYRMIYSQCTNCSENDRQSASIAASEAATRIFRIEELLDGKLGSPNMNQQGYRN